MDIKKLAIESGLVGGNNKDVTYAEWEKELNLFAQKIREARDAEWMAEPVGYFEHSEGADYDYCYFAYSKNSNRQQTPLFAQPKEVK